MGDIDATSYRYLDEWLLLSLVASVESLQRWWNFRYLTDDNDQVYRNTNIVFPLPEPPVILAGDVRPIILMAAIILKDGALQSMSWSTGSWRDAEISYSNIEGGKSRQESLRKDWEELKNLLTPPTKKLTQSNKMSLPGYNYGIYEYD
jgi:hypothetical protein